MNSEIDLIVNRIVERFHPQKIILFGSYANGTATKDSDVDLLVIMPVSGSKRDKIIEIRVAISESHLSKDIFVESPEKFERFKNIIGTIAYPAFKEGKVLYEKAA
ncbi:MAG: nucleotidyltransferase domain-containing protein [Elusimicrobia bacterium]|nr:nucleotidyltransferase domain-containing protein [Elusimicrobiota bacterium]